MESGRRYNLIVLVRNADVSLMCEVAVLEELSHSKKEEEFVEGLSRNYRSMTSIIIRFPVSRKRPHKAGEEVK